MINFKPWGYIQRYITIRAQQQFCRLIFYHFRTLSCYTTLCPVGLVFSKSQEKIQQNALPFNLQVHCDDLGLLSNEKLNLVIFSHYVFNKFHPFFSKECYLSRVCLLPLSTSLHVLAYVVEISYTSFLSVHFSKHTFLL